MRDDVPEPCTAEAKERGCTCWVPCAGSTDIDPPEPRISPNCPLHGCEQDPDDARDQRLEDERFFKDEMIGDE